MLSLSMIELTFCCGLAGLGDAAAGICVGSAAAAMANPANSKRSRRVSDGLAVNRLASSFAPRLVIRILQNHQNWPHSVTSNEIPLARLRRNRIERVLFDRFSGRGLRFGQERCYKSARRGKRQPQTRNRAIPSDMNQIGTDRRRKTAKDGCCQAVGEREA